MYFKIIIGFLFVWSNNLCGQGVGIGSAQVASSALLELQSTTKGTLLTRMSTTQRKAITNPEVGLLVFDTDKHTLYMYDGVDWRPMMFATTESRLPPFGVKAGDGMPGDQFGWSVALSGQYAVVGAPDDKIGNNSVQGSAYVFQNINGVWTQQSKLVASDGTSEDFFGRSVAIDGDDIVIGASFKSVGTTESAGKVYVFHRNGTTWAEQAILHASNYAESDHFGKSVAISGNRIIVGTPYKDLNGQTDKGCAYIFVRNGTSWSQQAMLNSPLSMAGDQMGECVSIDGHRVAIGAPKDDHNGVLDAGSVYVYAFNGVLWIMESKVFGSFQDTHAFFGVSLDIHGEMLAVGAPQADYAGFENLGVIEIFTYNGTIWENSASLEPPVEADGMLFGQCVALDGDRLVVGAPHMPLNGIQQQGKVWVYEYENNSFQFNRSVEEGEGQAHDALGRSLQISGANVIMGVFRKDQNRGKAFFINLD